MSAALLSERQQTAEALAREIGRMGAWIISPLPLDAGARLRFQVLDTDRDQVIEKLSSWNWSPALCGMTPRVTYAGLQPASIYEIDLPSGQPIVDRSIRADETAGQKEPAAEILAVLKHLGLRP
jgi:hypothetical protein